MGSELLKRKSKLERELREIDAKLRNCTHEWGNTVYDPKPEMVPYGCRYVGAGVDKWPEPEGYRESGKMIPRWRQTCQICGKSRYTTKTVPVEVKPVF